VEGLALCLAAAGHEVFVYARPNYTDKKLKEYQGVEIINLPSLFTKHLDAITHTFLACLDIIFRRKPDLVHFHGIGPCSLIWMIKLFRPGMPVIATFHCRDYFHQKWGLAARLFLQFGEMVCCRLADEVIVVSRELKKYADEKYGIESIYVPNAIKKIKNSPKVNINEFGLKRGEYILAVSRLIKHKGLHYLVKAYNNLKTKKKLIIVGEGSFTEGYVKSLKKLAETNPNIIFAGSQSGENLSALYANAYCFVQPSETEGLSMAILEAMSHGLPALVSDIPENKEAIREAGFIFKSKNINDLKNKINYLLKHPREARLKGSLAKERVEKDYNWANTIKDICEIYRLAGGNETGLLKERIKI